MQHFKSLNIREAAMKKWPFCLYYETHEDHILVIAVFHNARDPRELLSRIMPNE